MVLIATAAIAIASHIQPATPTRSPWVDRVEWEDTGPVAREHASVIVLGKTVTVFGGSGYEPQGEPLGDAWSYQATSEQWTQLACEGDVPTAAGSRRVATDPESGVAFLFGGYAQGFETNNTLHRVTAKSGSLVFERIEQVTPPPPRALHAFAYDPESERFVVTLGVSRQGFFGDTWIGEFDDEERVVWHEVDAGPGPRFGSSFGFDTEAGELVVLSGQLPPTPEAPMAMTDELWVFNCRGDTPGWRQITLDDPPPGRRNPTFAFDDEHDRLVVWCGTADARTNIEDLVLVHRKGGEWTATSLPDAESPPRRSSGFGFADPGSDRVYLGFGNSAEGRYRDWVIVDPTPAE